MDGKRQKFQLRRQRHNRQRILAFCLIFSLVLSNLNFGSMLTYATEGKRRTFEIGSDVKAVLKDGVLTVKGYGDKEISVAIRLHLQNMQMKSGHWSLRMGLPILGAVSFMGWADYRGSLYCLKVLWESGIMRFPEKVRSRPHGSL